MDEETSVSLTIAHFVLIATIPVILLILVGESIPIRRELMMREVELPRNQLYRLLRFTTESHQAMLSKAVDHVLSSANKMH